MPLIEELAVLSEINVGEMWDRLLGEFLGEWERLNRQQLTPDEVDRAISAFMGDLSEMPLDRLSRKTSGVSYNQGRNETIMDKANGIEFVVRSEVLDTNTCRPCSLLDGEIFAVDSSEYFANMPPAQCDGGDNCRGFYIPIAGQ